ncbi:MAG: cbb3-type cytochrome oxidase assembly protein CcoS [Magnetococcales bacterium]|nr:cbb3-type cytochrome oxidase assembly protein CcoS [Magnetococcales bacterium]
MDAIYILLPAALFLGLIGLGLMIWAVRSGQFEDMEGPSYRILFDDDQDMIPKQNGEKDKEKDYNKNKSEN